MKKRALLTIFAALALLTPEAWAQVSAGEGDPYVLAVMNEGNETLRAEWMDLRAEWMDLRIEQIEMLSVGKGRLRSRLHLQPSRWVAGDWRRAADGNKLTWLADVADGIEGTSLDPKTAAAALDRAMATWSSDSCMRKAPVLQRAATATDADIFDSGFGYGGLGDHLAADVVHAGWLPADFFDRVAGPGSGQSVVAFSVTFIYVDREGVPTDLDGDGFLDTAHSEVYYNQHFWRPGATKAMDLESVALHELGHSLGIGHIDADRTAVMNAIYAGPRTSLRSADHAALCSVWGSWAPR